MRSGGRIHTPLQRRAPSTARPGRISPCASRHVGDIQMPCLTKLTLTPVEVAMARGLCPMARASRGQIASAVVCELDGSHSSDGKGQWVLDGVWWKTRPDRRDQTRFTGCRQSYRHSDNNIEGMHHECKLLLSTSIPQLGLNIRRPLSISSEMQALGSCRPSDGQL